MTSGAVYVIQSLILLFGQIPGSLFHGNPGYAMPDAADSLPVYGYSIVNEYPHDTSAFTQGLIFKDGYMYEGTGLYGQSTLRKVVFESGTVIKNFHLDAQYFGEGVTIYHDTIHQLTWQNYVGFVYIEGDTFECIDTFSYATEGWGLTHNDTCLVMSDGSAVIRFLNPASHQVVGQITVTAEGVEVQRLNELEYIQGMIYANVWFCDSIAVIDPANGHVVCWIDCSGILSFPPNVLNGIAFDPIGVRLFVTGKLWPTLFEIEVDPINYPPLIVDYFPAPPCSITVDSTLLLGIMVVDPDPMDSLAYTWEINGVADTTAHDSIYAFTGTEPSIDTIIAIVTDGMYSDSVEWTVYVSDMGIEQEYISQPYFEVTIPNPYAPNAQITYFIADPSHVAIVVYDVAGRKTATLVNRVQACGKFSISPRLVPGVYFIRFIVGNCSRTYKRVIVN